MRHFDEDPLRFVTVDGVKHPVGAGGLGRITTDKVGNHSANEDERIGVEAVMVNEVIDCLRGGICHVQQHGCGDHGHSNRE